MFFGDGHQVYSFLKILKCPARQKNVGRSGFEDHAQDICKRQVHPGNLLYTCSLIIEYSVPKLLKRNRVLAEKAINFSTRRIQRFKLVLCICSFFIDCPLCAYVLSSWVVNCALLLSSCVCFMRISTGTLGSSVRLYVFALLFCYLFRCRSVRMYDSVSMYVFVGCFYLVAGAQFCRSSMREQLWCA